MQIPDVLVWGTGRWACQYIKALSSLGFNSNCIYVFGSNLPESHTQLCTEVSESKYSDFTNLLHQCKYSIVANSNSLHFNSFVFASKYHHNILCEKPLCIPIAQLLSHKYQCNLLQIRFWESLIPFYASYLRILRPIMTSTTSIEYVWHECMSDNSIRHGQNKLYDIKIDYSDDVIPNIVASLLSLGVCSLSDQLTLSSFTKFDSHSGSFSLQTSSVEIIVKYSRTAPARKRFFAAFMPSGSFHFDYTSESNLLFASEQYKNPFHFMAPFKSPLTLQLIDFFSDSSTRNLFSTSRCFIS